MADNSKLLRLYGLEVRERENRSNRKQQVLGCCCRSMHAQQKWLPEAKLFYSFLCSFQLVVVQTVCWTIIPHHENTAREGASCTVCAPRYCQIRIIIAVLCWWVFFLGSFFIVSRLAIDVR